MKQERWGKAKVIGILLITYAFAKFQGGFASWFLFYGCLTLAGYVALASATMFATLSVTREINRNRLKAGEDLVVTVRLRRRLWFPLGWNLIIEPLPDKLAGYFEPHRQLVYPWFKREVVIRYVIPSLPRGHYRLGEVTVRAGDFFGFLQRTRTFPLDNQFLVYPSYRELTHWPTGEGRITGSARASRRQSNDVASVRGVRDYQRGDRLSQIHWRASARGQGLKSKEFEHQASHQVVFFLDTEQLHYAGKPEDVFETAVQVTASLVHYTHRRQIPYGFSSQLGKRVSIPPATTQAHFFRVLDQLARVVPDGTVPFVRILGRDALEYPPGMMVTVVTPSLDKHLVTRLMELAAFGRNVHLFWITDSPIRQPAEVQAMQLLASVRVVCRTVYVHDDQWERIGGE